MSVVAILTGQVRGIRPLNKKDGGERFGTEISIVTEAGNEFGDTLKVTAFTDKLPQANIPAPKADVAWAVELKSSPQYGLSATYLSDMIDEPLRTF